MERYLGKLSAERIYEMSASQANHAFGELNYKWMGRNKSMQDAFRLAALAPDFLEARVKFLFQALKPYQREQTMAIIRGAAVMYGAGIIANAIFSDDHKTHWNKPFTVVLKGKEYSIRSIQGDLFHLYGNPRSFIYHRLNPTLVRPVMTWAQGFDQFGRNRDASEQLKDFVTGHLPIPLQGQFTGGEKTIIDSFLNSFGVTTYKSRTELERELRKHRFGEPGDKTKVEEKSRLKALYRNEQMDEYEKEKKASTKLTSIEKRHLDERLKKEKDFMFKQVPIEVAIKAWEKGTDEEKWHYGKMLKERIDNIYKSDYEKYKQFKYMKDKINSIKRPAQGIK